MCMMKEPVQVGELVVAYPDGALSMCDAVAHECLHYTCMFTLAAGTGTTMRAETPTDCTDRIAGACLISVPFSRKVVARV